MKEKLLSSVHDKREYLEMSPEANYAGVENSMMSTTSKYKSGSVVGQESSLPRREVDYYLNPTELFRWINYRRWDGAKSRTVSHPEECSTWIVSKNSSDGKVLWRRLPLHLVCMQASSAGQGNNNSSQEDGIEPINNSKGNSLNKGQNNMEDLIATLLQSYPEGASSPDHEGMLPLHLAALHGASERVLNSLLAVFPDAPNSRDSFGRTPLDVLKESPPGPHREPKIRVLERARETIDRMVSSVKRQSQNEISAVQQSAANERVASQRIIMRLEGELAEQKMMMENIENANNGKESRFESLRGEKDGLGAQLKESLAEKERLRKERNEILEKNQELRITIERHDTVVEKVKKGNADDRIKQGDQIANLRSDVATAKAMNEALEGQLRSRFTSEEFLSSSIVELEAGIQDLKKKYDTLLANYEEREREYTSETSHMRKNVEDLTKRNVTMQSRISDLNKEMSKLLASHSSLNAEQERLMEITVRYEMDMLDEMRSERERMMHVVTKQKQTYETMFTDQIRILEDGAKKEREIQTSVLGERERGMKQIDKLKDEFKAANAAERERKLQEAARMNSTQKSYLSSIKSAASASASMPRPSSRNMEKKHVSTTFAGEKSPVHGRRVPPSPDPSLLASRREPLLRQDTVRQAPPRGSSPYEHRQQRNLSSNPHHRRKPKSSSTFESIDVMEKHRKPYHSRLHQKSSNDSMNDVDISMSDSDMLGPTREGHLMRLLEGRAENNKSARSAASPIIPKTRRGNTPRSDYPVDFTLEASYGGPNRTPPEIRSPPSPQLFHHNDSRRPSNKYDSYSVNDESLSSEEGMPYGFETPLNQHQRPPSISQKESTGNFVPAFSKSVSRGESEDEYHPAHLHSHRHVRGDIVEF